MSTDEPQGPDRTSSLHGTPHWESSGPWGRLSSFAVEVAGASDAYHRVPLGEGASPIADAGSPNSMDDQENLLGPRPRATRRRRTKNLDGDIWEPLQWQDEAGTPAEASWSVVVEAGWFQLVTACVVLANMVMIILEMNHPHLRSLFFIPNQVTLCLYIGELICRMHYFKDRFFCASAGSVIWNVLDLVVVVAGVLDQWLLQFWEFRQDPLLKAFLTSLKLLRIVRVLKIVRVLLEANLSWAEGPLFQSFIGVVICFNAIVMGLETDTEWNGWSYIEQVLLGTYTFEIFVRLKAVGWQFFYNTDWAWNLMDFSIVLSSIVDTWMIPLICLIIRTEHPAAKSKTFDLGQIVTLMRILRLLRILRIIRLVKAVRPLYNLVMGVLAAMQGLGWVLVLTLVVLYAAGILATRLVGQGILFADESDMSAHVRTIFVSVPQSMFILFKIMNGAQSDEDASAIDALMNKMPALKFAFVFFLITSSWTLLSILTAVVSDNMIHTTSQQDKLLQITLAEETHKEHVRELKELFSDMDVDDDGTIDRDELESYLRKPEKVATFTRVCRVSCSDAMEVMNVLSRGSGMVEKDKLIECLTTVGNPVTEKAVLRLECMVEKLSRVYSQQENTKLARLEAQCRTMDRQNEDIKERLDRLEAQSTAAQGLAASLEGRLAGLERSTQDATSRLQELRDQSVAAQVRSLDDRVSALDRKNDEVLHLLRDFIGRCDSRTLSPQGHDDACAQCVQNTRVESMACASRGDDPTSITSFSAAMECPDARLQPGKSPEPGSVAADMNSVDTRLDGNGPVLGECRDAGHAPASEAPTLQGVGSHCTSSTRATPEAGTQPTLDC